MYPFYLGIDLHLKRSYLVLMSAEGEVIDKRRLKNTEIKNYIHKSIPKETYAVMEATRNWPFFYDLLEKHVDRVELAHDKGVRMIAEAGKGVAECQHRVRPPTRSPGRNPVKRPAAPSAQNEAS